MINETELLYQVISIGLMLIVTLLLTNMRSRRN
jgi:hypothetical protein